MNYKFRFGMEYLFFWLEVQIQFYCIRVRGKVFVSDYEYFLICFREYLMIDNIYLGIIVFVLLEGNVLGILILI